MSKRIGRSAYQREPKMTLEITYGDHKLDLEALPQTSIVALASAGLAHTLGNVVASKIVAEVRKTINADKPSDVTTEAVKAWRKAHEADISAMSGRYQSEALAAIVAGTLGVHSPRAPKASSDPLMTEMRKIAKAQIVAILTAAKLTFPGKDKTLELKGTSYTGEQMIANRLDVEYPKNNREAIEKEAKAVLAARKREMDKLADAGVDALA